MKASQAATLVAIIRAAFPREQLAEETPAIYARFLVDFEYAPAEVAVKRVICRSKFFPAIAELRAEVAEVTLGLPGELEAFRLAETFACWRPQFGPCARCAGSGYVDVDAGHVCEACHGEGRETVNRPAALAGPVAEALAYVGGRTGFLAGEPGVIRAHFRDAYRLARAGALERVSAPALAGARRQEIARTSREAA